MKSLALVIISLGFCTLSFSQNQDSCPGLTPEFTNEKYLAAGGIQFTDASTNDNNSSLTYSWDFGNGQESSEQNPFMVFDTEGDYSVTLTVTDQDGCQEQIQKVVNWSYDNN